MPKSRSSKKQKGSRKKTFVWNMKGCSKKNCSCMRGGSNLAYDPNRTGPLKLADYPLAYTGSEGLQKGGCGACSAGATMMKGGSSGGVPAPLVGTPWSSNPASWPGANPNSPHDGTQLGLNDYKVQPEMNAIANRDGSFGPPKVGGGRTRRQRQRKSRRQVRRSKKRYQKRKFMGGGPGLSGIFGGIGSDLNNAYATLNGTSVPVNPNPWVQYTGQDNLGYVNFSSNSHASRTA
jgi:hypothetical protein